MKPDRIVIGSDSENATQLLRRLYQPFQRNRDRLIVMDLRSAELTKYAANAMLATRISFMNEMAVLAEELGADIEQVRHGIGADPRIGYHFLYAGCGYGGSCFPKDVHALRRTAQENEVRLRVLDAVEAANDAQKRILVEKVRRRYGEELSGRHFALWGLAFKPNTDDMREAPSRTIIEALWAMGATVAAHDPAAMDEARRIYGERADLTLSENPMAALAGADALLIVTEWKAFRSPDFEMMKSLLKHPVIFDGRNLYDPQTMRASGFDYFAIGRPT
jgi:UDPglucose 6-dehydrogenase